jgi:hypothetical protein
MAFLYATAVPLSTHLFGRGIWSRNSLSCNKLWKCVGLGLPAPNNYIYVDERRGPYIIVVILPGVPAPRFGPTGVLG